MVGLWQSFFVDDLLSVDWIVVRNFPDKENFERFVAVAVLSLALVAVGSVELYSHKKDRYLWLKTRFIIEMENEFGINKIKAYV